MRPYFFLSFILNAAEARFAYPMFIKPAGTGSSVGVSKAKNREVLLAALRNAAKFDRKILIEEFINGTTIETRLNEVKQVRQNAPSCKLVMLCDENSAPDIAHAVANAKKDRLIDAFFYSSVTEKYLTAVLASL